MTEVITIARPFLDVPIEWAQAWYASPAEDLMGNTVHSDETEGLGKRDSERSREIDFHGLAFTLGRWIFDGALRAIRLVLKEYRGAKCQRQCLATA